MHSPLIHAPIESIAHLRGYFSGWNEGGREEKELGLPPYKTAHIKVPFLAWF